MTDNGLTPHIVVDATVTGVDVPERFVVDGKIILNISYAATDRLALGTEALSFRTRFAGVSSGVAVPVAAVLGIYAQETGQGMIFTEEESQADVEDAETEPVKAPPELKIIK